MTEEQELAVQEARLFVLMAPIVQARYAEAARSTKDRNIHELIELIHQKEQLHITVLENLLKVVRDITRDNLLWIAKHVHIYDYNRYGTLCFSTEDVLQFPDAELVREWAKSRLNFTVKLYLENHNSLEAPDRGEHYGDGRDFDDDTPEASSYGGILDLNDLYEGFDPQTGVNY